MANNVVLETHCTPTMNRSLGGDTETYQQFNYQTFQMLVLSVVDPLNCMLNNTKIFNYYIGFLFHS